MDPSIEKMYSNIPGESNREQNQKSNHYPQGGGGGENRASMASKGERSKRARLGGYKIANKESSH